MPYGQRDRSIGVAMIYPTLAAVRASLREFSEASGYRDAHVLIRLPSGHWTRTLGNTQECIHVRGNVWHMVSP